MHIIPFDFLYFSLFYAFFLVNYEFLVYLDKTVSTVKRRYVQNFPGNCGTEAFVASLLNMKLRAVFKRECYAED